MAAVVSPTPTKMATNDGHLDSSITDEEAALYDRQIRLWGLDAQKRISAARVLVVGLGGLGAEIAKNLILAGVKTMTLNDHRQVSQFNRIASFLLSEDSLGKNRAEASRERAQNLNPNVEVKTDTEPMSMKNDDFFEQFDIVCVTEYRCSLEGLKAINESCRKKNVKFYCADTFGFFGLVFCDLGPKHEFVHEVSVRKRGIGQSQESMTSETKLVAESLAYIPIWEALNRDVTKQKILDFFRRPKKSDPAYIVAPVVSFFCSLHPDQMVPRRSDLPALKEACYEMLGEMGVTEQDFQRVDFSFLDLVFGELSPTCAVVGGVVAQDVIKVISARDRPIRNTFLFNAISGAGITDRFGSL